MATRRRRRPPRVGQNPAQKRYAAVVKAPRDSNVAQAVLYVLDHFNAEEIDAYKKRFQDLYDFFWREFTFYSHARSRKTEEIRGALSQGCEPYSFENWYRVVALQFSSTPLSSKGSRLSTQGGRFNIGNLDPTKFLPFPALYLAEDSATARSEWFRRNWERPDPKMKPSDFSLTPETSHSVVRLRGALNDVLDLTNEDVLRTFVRKIRRLVPSEELLDMAKRLGLNPPKAIGTIKELKKALFAPDWSFYPTFLEIPHNSQVFGLLAKLAGVQGLIYPSKFTKRRCLAIFPENLTADDSMIELTDAFAEGTIAKLDKDSWKDLT